jgi:pentatricopeptide repeat domain-containing protein 1/leucine-rich PPR motif-containing protein
MVDKAMNLFEEMQSKKITPDAVTYNSLIDGLFKSGKISFALELVDEMHDRGQPADVITYNSLLHALCKNHQLDKAIAFVNKMKAKVFSQMFAHTIY